MDAHSPANDILLSSLSDSTLDSEQVIIAQNEDGQLKYMSGALEDPDINNEVCQILEGGKNAFEKRERKYRISHIYK